MMGVDLADEDAKFMKYLADNGWQGEVGEDDDDKELITDIGGEEGDSQAGEAHDGKDLRFSR